MIKNGVLISNSHNICYAHNDLDLILILNAYEKTLSTLARALNKKSLKENLRSIRIVTPVFQVREKNN